MNETQSSWSLGPCPVCEGGTCRVRWCGGATPALPIVLCDECDAYWTSPDFACGHGFLDAESGRVGESDWYAWGDEARWATADEVTLLGWDRPSGPVSTDWVFPATDSTLSNAISFFVDSSSIILEGAGGEGLPQDLDPTRSENSPAKEP